MNTLKTLLEEWCDADGTCYVLGKVLGMWSAPWDPSMKGVFWTQNPTTHAFHHVLNALVELGVLELDLEETRYRWNPAYRGPFEPASEEGEE